MNPFAFVVVLLAPCFSVAQARKPLYTVRDERSHNCKYSYIVTNAAGDTALKLDTSKYTHCFTKTFSHFAVVSFRHKPGWWAIDIQEHVLFEIFNAGYSEPDPDKIANGMIRIVDKNRHIGFANYKGQIVIKPQFDDASSFYKGLATVGIKCIRKQVDDEHYSLSCERTGYINKRGKVTWYTTGVGIQ